MALSLGGAEAGAQTGGMAGPWGALAGGILGGFLGGPPQLPKELQRLYHFQLGIAKQLNNQSNSIPLSDPQEQAALASQRGLLGQEWGQQSQNLNSLFNANTATPGQIGDMAQNQANSFQGFSQSLNAQHLLAALNRRQNLKLQAANVAGGAAGSVKDYQPRPDFASLFGNIAKLSAYKGAQNQGGGSGQNAHGMVDDSASRETLGPGPGQPGFIGPQQSGGGGFDPSNPAYQYMQLLG